MVKRILFLVPYPLHESPSQRFRFEQYFDYLHHSGYTYKVQTFLNAGNWRAFFRQGNTLTKATALISGFCKRIFVLFTSPMYDFVFIHREVTPVGPPIFEWLLAKVLRRKIVYDFDDAIWLTDRANESWFFKLVKWRSKVAAICSWSYKVSCGNEYLCDYARRFNSHVIYNPTTIDTESQHNIELFKVSKPDNRRLTIGWTGSHSTLKYLDDVEDVLSKILSDYSNVDFLVIADRKPSLNKVALRFLPWNADTEIQDLLQLDIGIMPLPDDEWANGKCGFKALQYLALERPAVVSPVGVNSTIIEDGINGFLCATPEQWEIALRKLIEDSQLRNSMGKNGRVTVEQRYSVRSNASTFLSLFA